MQNDRGFVCVCVVLCCAATLLPTHCPPPPPPPVPRALATRPPAPALMCVDWGGGGARCLQCLEFWNKLSYNRLFEFSTGFVWLTRRDTFPAALAAADLSVSFPEYRG